ncbi:putative mediator of RNA polymerase II transcription subunit 15 [Eurosta solidaginis]|uniref:putative mediator of RNA polymerase II transcription subunit 15 n=1 Tax=Eurosta solidaginis TaxID=178769 RepID=UPI0035317A0C
MHSQSTYALVTCLISVCSAIRVHFNTNTGPIVPPTPRTTVRPLLPYREPAPVWEDLSNDIPNPNPYTYILPPPSRPRPNGYNFPTAWQKPSHYYGNLLLNSNKNTFFQQGNTNLGTGSLAAKYIPNVGIRYTAVVAPQIIKNKSSTNNNNYVNSGSNYYGYEKKLHGKYNEKTKKYKAYEKVKYVPQNYFPHQQMAQTIDKPFTAIFNKDQLIRAQQQLPHPEPPTAFQPLNSVTTKPNVSLDTSTSAAKTNATAAPTISSNTYKQTELAYEKDQTFTKSKSNLWKQPKKSSYTAVVGQKANAISSVKSR